MIRRWAGPVVVGILSAAAASQMVMVTTPATLMNLAVRRVAETGGMNRFTHASLATAVSRAIVRPSPDLAYSSCPFDLTNGPLLIDAVPVLAPYWSLSIFDSRTDVALVRNGIKAKYRPFHLAVMTSGQTAPAGYEVLHVEGKRGIALVRILVDSGVSFPGIDRQRRATTCRTV